MIRQYDFQDKAVEWLYDTASSPMTKQTMVMKAPTGAGKTVILLQFIDKYLRDHERNTAFIWLCPGKGDLEEQSRNRMRQFYPNRVTKDLFDVLTSGFEAGSTSFINWERVTKKDNKAITMGEKKNLYDQIAQAHRNGTEFIIIIDEEHSNNTSKASDIIDKFAAKHIVRVSATTVANRNVEMYEIDEQDVINEGLISTAISVNEGAETGIEQLDSVLIELADAKRQEILKAYKSLGKNIRPLVLIQFPNGSPEKIEEVENKLREMKYTRENGMVAAWLSGDKKDIPDDLTANNSQLSFLFIKQAINTGWDCPRAKILVKLREGGNEAFQIQTIGRIRRMPEGHHYDNSVLDMCYVYTFDEQYKSELLAGLDKAYVPRRLFLKEKCRDLTLTKELRDMDGGSIDMRSTYNQIYQYYVKQYNLDSKVSINQQKLKARGYRFDKQVLGSMSSGIVTRSDDLEKLKGNIETKTTVNTHIHGMELRHTIDEFKHILGIEAGATRAIMERLFCFKEKNKYKILNLSLPDFYAFIINNAPLIKEDLRGVASEVYSQDKLLFVKTAPFSLPTEDFYHFDETVKRLIEYQSNAYKAYNSGYVTTNCKKSDPEIMFEQFCESHRYEIDWVYKNGDSGQQYLSVVYHTGIRASQRLFYPDYILRMKDGTVWIIEAKGGQKGSQDNNIDRQVVNKFNAFKRYASEYNIRWGFVRPYNHSLYLNNSDYVSDMNDDRWVPLDEALGIKDNM